MLQQCAHIQAHAVSIGTIDSTEKICLVKDLYKLQEKIKCSGQFAQNVHELKQLVEILLLLLLSNDRIIGYTAYETINLSVRAVVADPFDFISMILNIQGKKTLFPAEIYRLRLLNGWIRSETAVEIMQNNKFFPLLNASISTYQEHEDIVFLVEVMDLLRTIAKLLGQTLLDKDTRVKLFQSLLNRGIVQKITCATHMKTHYLQNQAMKLLIELYRAFCAIQQDEALDKGNSQDLVAHMETTWYGILIDFLLKTAENALEIMKKTRESHNLSIGFAIHDGECPFIQEWMLLVGMAFLSYFDCKIFQKLPIEKLMGSQNSLDIIHSLLSISQILEVISEEDDMLSDFLYILLNMYILEETHQRVSTVSCACSTYVLREFQPDLLFIKFIKIIGQDPIVCIDFLVSTETNMLMYLARYLRRLNSAWSQTVMILQQNGEEIEILMTFLIRLRFEIEKLHAARMFPYNPSPLIRRILAIEALYEATSKEESMELTK